MIPRWNQLLGLLAVTILLGACQKSAVVKQRGSTKDMYPDHESWESTVVISRNGLLVAVADSRRMIKYNDRNLAHLIGEVDVDFYNEAGQHMSHLSSDSADVDMQANRMSAFGHVIIRSDSGLVLETETLRWDDTYDMVTTEDTVQFTTLDNDTLYGVGFESDVDLTHWKIYQPWGVTARGFGVGK
ncbi:MAG: LPS export ABC transporter periplasmic protein LptC [Fidelibacterota bacterium]|nr:MAG: LPS export ABC transporter periplasmic protein LptC [Candidatus Neomarinimicrobiota bacterium]